MKLCRLCTGTITLLALALVGCAEKVPEHSTISEKPASLEQAEKLTTSAGNSHISTRARIAYTDLVALAEAKVPEHYAGNGSRKVCKKVIGLKLCGTAQWHFDVNRLGTPEIRGENDQAIITVPMKITGNAGIRGDVAKLLSMDAMNFSGALTTTIALGFDLDNKWCPVIDTDITYQWTQPPSLSWRGKLDFDLQSKVDEAIAKQLGSIDQKLANTIDCNTFREKIAEQWRSHSIELQLLEAQTMFLNVFPTGFGFSGVRSEADHIGLAFFLDAETSLQSAPVIETRSELAEVQRKPYEAGRTVFDLLVYADYDRLQTLAAPQIVGKTFSEESAAGNVSVTVNSLDIGGSVDGVTVTLGFDALLPGMKLPTPATVYLSAHPIVDSDANTVRLSDIRLSNIIDSTLWSVIASVFKSRIISEIERNSVLDFSEHVANLEQQLQTQLSDPARTGGLKIDASEVNVTLQDLSAEHASMAALMRVESTLEVTIPFAAINR